MSQKIIPTSALKGFLGTSLLLIIYFSIVTLISGWDFAEDQFTKFWYFVVTLAVAFGVQVGLYSYLKNSVKQNISPRVVATSGVTSTAAMVSCCAHYLINVLPILGVTGLIALVSQYQVQFFWIGLVFNFAGIAYVASKVYRFSKGI